MCSRDFPCSGSSPRLRMIVGCGPPNPSRGPISTEPSSSRSSTTKSRTSHQNRASTSGSRQPSTSSLIRHAINETRSQPGNRRGDHTRTSWAPSSENNPAIVPDEASTGEAGLVAPRMAVCGGLLVNRPLQVEVEEQRGGAQVEVVPDRLGDPGSVDLLGAEGLDEVKRKRLSRLIIDAVLAGRRAWRR